MNKTNILWLRKNLRMHDNPTLLHASNHSEKLVCVFIYDEVIHYKQHGVDSLGPYRAKFLWESLSSLKKSLQAVGNDLLILQGDAVEILKSLHEEVNAATIFTQTECGQCEQEQEQAVSQFCNLETINITTLLNCDQLPFSKETLPNNFIVFRRLIEQQWEAQKSMVSKCCETPKTLPPVPDTLKTQSLSVNPASESKPQSAKASFLFKGDEQSGLDRVEQFIWNGTGLENYRDTCNQLLGADYSSKLSPWIANGSVSVRYVYHEIRRFEQERIENDSTRWAVCELLWRDFFHFNALKHGSSIFSKGGIQSNSCSKKSIDIDQCHLVQNWCKGETGNRFVDAIMKELLETGYLSNRGRQSISAYFVKEMGSDWRLGASWFEHLLIDFEPCNNYGNWNFQSGIGHDVKKLANFSIDQEAQRYDPQQAYQNYWLGDHSEA
ncbi:DASH family cryptochrome [Leucothrix arctica]|uniref:Cryptochrome DASH n=1 Tax=Leucothrix arctica TaxID=1481894 RepID=A0A317CKW0_9GAMM|nr:DASH family cryptochrome [Leucothrix arctica]PWQ98811.1 hypothetical protein DKT75_03125 [Leucothrix arctica]